MPALLSNRSTKPSVSVPNAFAQELSPVPETESGEAYSSYTMALRVAEENEDFDAACKVLVRWFGIIAAYHAKAAAQCPDVECDLTFWPMCQREAKTALALYRRAGKDKRSQERNYLMPATLRTGACIWGIYGC